MTNRRSCAKACHPGAWGSAFGGSDGRGRGRLVGRTRRGPCRRTRCIGCCRSCGGQFAGSGEGSGSAEVALLCEPPSGLGGRPSKSLTPEQVDDVLTKTAPDRMHNYIVLSLLTGGRTEELRALRWDHVHLDGFPEPRPSPAAVRRGLAVCSHRWRHEDPPVPADARAPGPLRRCACGSRRRSAGSATS